MTRSQVHVSTQHHHTFNVQIRPDLRSPLVQIKLRNNGNIFSGVGMLDSGCTTCIIPISRLPEDARRHMTKSNIRVKGIGGNISILGKLTCDITLGDDTSEGVIEPCNDPKGFNSPVFAVRKKNGKIRVVANFKRTLNKVLVDLDPYPIPTIDSTFNKIGEGNKYFSTLDLRNGY